MHQIKIVNPNKKSSYLVALDALKFLAAHPSPEFPWDITTVTDAYDILLNNMTIECAEYVVMPDVQNEECKMDPILQ